MCKNCKTVAPKVAPKVAQNSPAFRVALPRVSFAGIMPALLDAMRAIDAANPLPVRFVPCVCQECRQTTMETVLGVSVECPNCIQLEARAFCVECEEEFRVSDLNELDDETFICNKCGHHCDDCGEYSSDETHTVGNGDEVCDSCLESYIYCANCNEYESQEDSYTTSGGQTICNGCYCEHYFMCEECEEVFRDTQQNYVASREVSLCNSCYQEETEDEYGSLCEDYSQTIDINGHKGGAKFDLKRNATKEVSAMGINAVQSLMRANGINDFFTHYVTPEATTKQGSFTTRLNKFYKEQYQIDLTKTKVMVTRKKSLRDENGVALRDESGAVMYEFPTVETNALSEIGNIVSQNLTSPLELKACFSRKLGVKGDGYKYVNGGSCWYGEAHYAESLCIHKANYGFMFKVYNPSDELSGRLMVLPVKARFDDEGELRVTPCDDDECGTYMAFNGYSRNEIACGNADKFLSNLLADELGLSVCHVGFEPDSMYVNSGGYLISDKNLINQIEGEVTAIDSGFYKDCSCQYN